MKIFHTIPRFPYIGGDTIIGGYASALLNLSAYQAKTHDVTIVGQMLNKDIDQVGGVSLRHIEISARASTLQFVVEYCRKSAQEIANCSAFDIVQVHSGFAEYVLADMLIQRKVNAPVLHTLYCPLKSDGLRASIVGSFVKASSRMRNQHFVCISKNIADSLIAAGVSKSHIYIVPPAVNVHKFSQCCAGLSKDDIRGECSLPDGRPVLLFVGNKKREKNLDGVLKALKLLLAKFPDTLLVATTELAFKEYDKRDAYLRKLINELDLESHVRWVGITDKMPLLMAAADVVVTPFLHTIGPSDYFIAAIEAMAAGTPVLVSPVGGMPEIVDASRGRLANPNDPQEIAQALGELLGEKKLRRELGDNARKFAIKKFNPKSIAMSMESIYLEVCYE